MIPGKPAHKRKSNRGTRSFRPTTKGERQMDNELSTEQLDSIATAAEAKADKTHGDTPADDKDDKDDTANDKNDKNDDDNKDDKDDTSDDKDDKDPDDGTDDKDDDDNDDKGDDEIPDEDIVNKPDEDLSDEQINRKNDLIKAKKDKDDLFETDAKALSEEHNVSIDEAKKQIEAEDKFSEKYGKDPRKLARTARELQQVNSKNEAKIKELEEQRFAVDLGEGEIMMGGQVMKKDVLVDAYLKEFPKEKDRAIREFDKKNPDDFDLDEDEKWEKAKSIVFSWIKQDLISASRKNMKDRETVVSIEAKTKKDTLISNISEADKKYIPSVKKILDHTPNGVILGKSFDLKALLNHERGKPDNLKNLEKVAEERGYKRGLEKANILGVKGGPEKKTGIQKGKNSTFGLSKAAQTDALQMFSGGMYSHMSNYDKFKEYSEMNIGDLKTK